MKYALSLIAIAAFATADDHGFPSDSMFHASCHLTATLPSTSCADAKTKADQLIKDNVDTDSQYKGTMAIKDEGDDWIWSTRLTYNKKYTDDQLFEFSDDASGCKITARSRSQSVSYLDNSVNFCNMWNLVSRAGTGMTYSVSDCHSHPDSGKEAETCTRY